LEAAYQQKGKSVVLRFPSNGCLIESFMLHSAHLAEILTDDARPTHFLPLSEPLARSNREKQIPSIQTAMRGKAKPIRKRILYHEILPPPIFHPFTFLPEGRCGSGNGVL
jgi:hypothetical protein